MKPLEIHPCTMLHEEIDGPDRTAKSQGRSHMCGTALRIRSQLQKGLQDLQVVASEPYLGCRGLEALAYALKRGTAKCRGVEPGALEPSGIPGA